jgi:hypothetical protein
MSSSKVGGYNFFRLIYSPGHGESLLNICCISKPLIVDRGSMYCNNSGGACFFFEIDAKGGESVVISRMLKWYSWMFLVISRILQWYSWMFFKVAINFKGGDC